MGFGEIMPITLEPPTTTQPSITLTPPATSGIVLQPPVPPPSTEHQPLKDVVDTAKNPDTPNNPFPAVDSQDKFLSQNLAQNTLQQRPKEEGWEQALYRTTEVAANVAAGVAFQPLLHPLDTAYNNVVGVAESAKRILTGQTVSDFFTGVSSLDPYDTSGIHLDAAKKIFDSSMDIVNAGIIWGGVSRFYSKMAGRYVSNWVEKEVPQAIINQTEKEIKTTTPVPPEPFEPFGPTASTQPSPSVAQLGMEAVTGKPVETKPLRPKTETKSITELAQQTLYPKEEGFKRTAEDLAQEKVFIQQGLSHQDITELQKSAEREEAKFNKIYDPAPAITKQFKTTQALEAHIENNSDNWMTQSQHELVQTFMEQNPKEWMRMQLGLSDEVAKSRASLPPNSPAEQVANNALHNLSLHDGGEDAKMIQRGLWGQVWDKAISASTTVLRNAGKIGDTLATKLMNYIDIPELRLSQIQREYIPVLKTLSQTETKNLINKAEAVYYGLPHIESISPRVQAAFDKLDELNTRITQEIYGKTGQTGTPRMFHPRHLLAQPLDELKLKQYLVKHKLAANDAEATNLIQKEYERIAESRAGMKAPAEQKRKLILPTYDALKEFGYNVNPIDAWNKHYLATFRRIEQINQFGKDGEVYNQLLGQLGQDKRYTNAADIGQRLYTRLTNGEVIDPTLSKLQRAGNNFSYMLWQAGVAFVHLASGGSNLITRYGLKTVPGLIKATYGLLTGADRNFMANAGVLRGIMSDYNEWGGFNSRMSKVLSKVNGIDPIMNYMRRVGATLGDPYIEKMVQRTIKSNGTDTLANKALKELYINPQDVIKNKGIAQQDKYLAIKRIADATIGRVRPVDLPLWATTPEWEFLTMFKKAATRQAQFMLDMLKQRPLTNTARFLVGGLPFAATIGLVKSKMMGETDPEKLTDAAVHMGMKVTFGIVGEAINAANAKTKEQAVEFGAGPTISTTAAQAHTFVSGLTKWLSGEITGKEFRDTVGKGVVGSMIRMIPPQLGGGLLYKELFP